VRVNRSLWGDATAGNVNVPVTGLIVDPSFLAMFNFRLAKGKKSDVLREPHHVVLTHETAERIFGKRDPLGQALHIGNFGDFTVVGVLEPFPSKTHFEYQLLVSSTGIETWEKQRHCKSFATKLEQLLWQLCVL